MNGTLTKRLNAILLIDYPILMYLKFIQRKEMLYFDMLIIIIV